MDVSVNKETKLVSIEYPGIVENPDKMLETLGGEINISKTYNDPSRRLELRFRPDDVYAKPACGDRFNATSVLLRVRRRKAKKKDTCTAESTGRMSTQMSTQTSTTAQAEPSSSSASSEDKIYQGSDGNEYKADVIGIIDSVYKFNGMADFQYLPMARQDDGTYKSLREQLILSRLEDRSWLAKEAPLFLPPPIFSRLDVPMDYAYRDGPKHGPNPTLDKRPPHIIGVARQRRPQYTLFAMFDDEKMPSKPYDEAVKKVKVKLKDMDKHDFLKKVFEERPIWSKNALKYHTRLTSDQLKCLLPTVAYYFVTGPWRTLWVRLGFDPRKEPSMKKFQLLDFRVRQKTAAERLRINTKRSTYRYNLPNTVQKTSSSVAVIKADTFNIDWSSAANQTLPDHAEASWKFRPGLVPPFRQMFYQFLDIEEPDIQKLVSANDGKEDKCTETDGWCLPDTQKHARNILYTHLKDFINSEPDAASHSLSAAPAISRKAAAQAKKSAEATAAAVAAVGVDSDDESLDSGDDEGDDEGPLEEEDEVNEMETELLEHMGPEEEDAGEQMVEEGVKSSST